ncbi:MAG: hypothetical protein M1335_01090 [Chloroflexi bacterium]|nr:hypothetical protein [Chloroflexota bacterium]
MFLRERFAAIFIATGMILVVAGCGGGEKTSSSESAKAAKASSESGESGGSDKFSEKTAAKSVSTSGSLDGKSLAETNCVRCHKADIWKGVNKSKDDWSKIVDQMSRLGASKWITSDQALKVVVYLSDQEAADRAAAMAADARPTTPPDMTEPVAATSIRALASTSEPAGQPSVQSSGLQPPAQPNEQGSVPTGENGDGMAAAIAATERTGGAAGQAPSVTTADVTSTATTPQQQAYTGAEVWLYLVGGGAMIVSGLRMRWVKV